MKDCACASVCEWVALFAVLISTRIKGIISDISSAGANENSVDRLIVIRNNKYETPVRIHLKNVYATLTLATIAASLQRLSLLGIFAFLTGCNLGPFLNLAVTINPALVLQALLGASVIFACFSLSALYAPDGHYLYLRGTLMSVLLTLIWVSIYNIFFGSQLLFKANLYIGLAVMCGFIVYDTQFIVERARRGDMDYVMHSLNLFVDFVGVFWRLLMILTNKTFN
nr:probable Bax inhibitor 1 [Penaeus vannamei]